MMSINLIEKYNNHNKESVKWGKLAPWIVMFLLLPPIIGLPVIIYYIWNNKTRTKTDYYVFMFCIAIYMGAINATKIPGGDQMQYHMAYLNVPIQGFIGSLTYIYGFNAFEGGATGISGEFMNGVYNYVGYYLTFGYYPLFAFIYTFISYLLLFTGLYKFCSTFEKPHIPIVCGILTIAFFYLYFQYTLQIQKQFFAQAIIMYVIGDYAKNGKLYLRDWIALFCAVFTHQSMLFFIPFLVLKRFRKQMNRGTELLILLVLGLLIYYGPSLLGGGANNVSSNALTYGVNRFANSEINNDTKENALVFSQVLVIALPMALICWKKMMAYRRHFMASQSFLVVVVSLLLVTVTVMFKQPTAQYRFFMMLIAFMPFIYPMSFDKIKLRDNVLNGIAVVMIAWFFMQYEKIVWSYAPEMHIILKNPILLVAANYQGF